MNNKEYELYKIEELSKERGEAARRKALLTPKGYGRVVSEAHTPRYMDAIRELNTINNQLKDLLVQRIRSDRMMPSNPTGIKLTWTAIKEKYKISQSTLNYVRGYL